VEQEPLTLPEYLGSSPVFSEVRVIRSLVLCVMFCRSLFVLFLLAIVLSVLLRFTDSDYRLQLDRGLLLTRKLLNQGFLLVKLKSSL
jgi:hypothetical protein